MVLSFLHVQSINKYTLSIRGVGLCPTTLETAIICFVETASCHHWFVYRRGLATQTFLFVAEFEWWSRCWFIHTLCYAMSPFPLRRKIVDAIARARIATVGSIYSTLQYNAVCVLLYTQSSAVWSPE